MVVRVSMSFGALSLVILASCFSPTLRDDVDEQTTGSTSATSGPGMATSSSGQTANGTTTTGSDTSGESSETSSIETGSSSSGSSSSSTTEGVLPGCGDGVKDPEEECDDGNLDEEDACNSTCETQFFGGDSTPCTLQQSEVCSFLAGTCHRTVSPAAGGAVCYWESFSAGSNSCDETPGQWILPDDAFGDQRGVFLPEPGACFNFAGNLSCTAAEQTACDAAGASVCFQDKDVDGVGNLGDALCGWDVSQAECDATPGVWTSSGSTFEQNHPNSVPPGSDGACITQAANV